MHLHLLFADDAGSSAVIRLQLFNDAPKYRPLDYPADPASVLAQWGSAKFEPACFGEAPPVNEFTPQQMLEGYFAMLQD